MNKKTNLLTAAVMAGVGIALIILHNHVDILQWISILLGVMFIIPSLWALGVSFLGHRPGDDSDSSTQVSTIVASIGGIGLGVAMCLIPSTFAGLFIYVFAGVLIVAGIYHFIVVRFMSKTFVIPGFYYIIPSLLVVAGLVIMFSSLRTLNNVVVLITGVMLILSAINSFIEYIGTMRQPRRALPRHEESAAKEEA